MAIIWLIAASWYPCFGQSPSAVARPAEEPNLEARPDPTQPSAASRAVPLLPPSSQSLTLSDVIASVYQSFPMIQQARLEGQIANGARQSAQGWWDPKLEGYSLSQPTGFYQNYRNGVGLSRNLWWGGYLSSGYRIGRGEFQPWYKERETNEGGELKLAWVQPLLQGRAIDPGRVALFQAGNRQQSVGPLVQREVLDSSLDAASVYWSWVNIGLQSRAQQELLRLAEIRVKQIEKLVKSGDEKSASLLFNDQLVAERKGKLLDTIRKLRESSFKLSLFLRDAAGNPIVPQDDWLPGSFPTIGQLPAGDYQQDLANAVERRPEVRLIELDLERTQWDLRLAQNQLYPQLDFVVENSQDVGLPASSLRDKSRYELEAGVMGSVPLPRNKARGKIQETRGKMSQIAVKREFQINKIGVELQTARTGLEIAAERVKQANTTVEVAIRYLELAEKAYGMGEVNLLDLNILESKAFEARFGLLQAQQDWFTALAAMQAALGLDPLDQATQISDAIPTSPAPTFPGLNPEATAPEKTAN